MKASCPNGCRHKRKFGFYKRKTGRLKRVPRYICRDFGRTFSKLKGTLRYRQRKPHINQKLFRYLGRGISQRVCAEFIGVHRTTIARRVKVFGELCRKLNKKMPSQLKTKSAYFDEMETFEHTKLKPLSIALAVTKERHILSVKVSRMPAKGRLTAISLKRYGYRKDERAKGLSALLKEVKTKAPELIDISSDECPRYPRQVREILKDVNHLTFKGRRACVAGLGELKVGGFDPLFPLNHTCAMYRDNLKRLSRKTWCTTKDPKRLQDLTDLYARFHNQRIAGIKRLARIDSATRK